MKNERWKIEELVFDKPTLLTLAKIMEKGLFDKLDHIISQGKEANVYRASKGKRYIALKIYKVETARFFRRQAYIEGDPRFPNIKKDDRSLVKMFASKEYKNLKIAEEAGVPAPEPFIHLNNVVVFSFLGKNGLPYPKMIEALDITKKEDFYDIIESIKVLYEHGLVHADLSAYNILKGDKNYLIDFSQGVVLRHPRADEFLKRDIFNITSFFKKHFGINEEFEHVEQYVKGFIEKI